MQKRYNLYYKKLFPNNPMEILRNQFILQDNQIVQLDSKGKLVSAADTNTNKNLKQNVQRKK